LAAAPASCRYPLTRFSKFPTKNDKTFMGQAQLAVITSRKITPANLIIDGCVHTHTATDLVAMPVLISSGLDNETALCANEIPLRWSCTHELQIYSY
jgi:hypothetical protein